MPDKPLETTWVGTRMLPVVRRGRRFSRRLLRGARSRVRPRIGTLGELGFSLPAASALSAEADGQQIRRLDVVVLSAPHSTEQIPAAYLKPLIGAEQHSIPTVLAVTRAEELAHPVAAVVTHLVTTDPALLPAVERFAGTERSALLEGEASAGSRAAALRRLTRVHTPVGSR